MKIPEVHPEGIRGIGVDEQRQKMLHDFNGQITEIFLFERPVSGIRVCYKPAELSAAQTDMRSVVGQADV